MIPFRRFCRWTAIAALLVASAGITPLLPGPAVARSRADAEPAPLSRTVAGIRWSDGIRWLDGIRWSDGIRWDVSDPTA